MQSKSVLLTIIIINYFSLPDIQKCLRTLSIQTKKSLLKNIEILIINNSPSEIIKPDRLSILIPDVKNIQILTKNRNIGFGAGMNLGAKHATGKFLLFLNSDISFKEDFLSPLLKFYQGNKKIGLISPVLKLQNGRRQFFANGSKPGLFTSLKNLLGLKKNKVPILGYNQKSEWISGTCMMISRKKFNILSGFDERFFMYYEDVDLCLRAMEKGWSNFTLSGASLIHYGGARIIKHKKLYYTSQDIFNKKYYGTLYSKSFKMIRSVFFMSKKNLALEQKKLSNNSLLTILVQFLSIIGISILLGLIINLLNLTIFISIIFLISTVTLSFLYTEKSFLILIFLLPLQFSVVSNHYIPYIRIIIPVFIIVWFIKRLLRKKISIPIDTSSILWTMFLIIMALSLLVTNQLEGIGKFLLILTFFPFYIVSRNIFASRRASNIKRKIVRSLLYSGLIINIIGVVQFSIQFIFGLEKTTHFLSSSIGPILWSKDLASDFSVSNSWIVDFNGSVIMRAISIFSSPHHYSFYLALIIPLSLSLLIYSIINKKKELISFPILFSMNILAILCLMLTFSRGAYLSFLLAIVILLFYLFKSISIKKRVPFLTILITLFILTIIIINPLVGHRVSNLFNINEPSNQERLTYLKRSAEILKDNWLTGVGYGRFDTVTKFKGFENTIKINAHNTYLEIWIEIGLLGAMVVLLLFILPIIKYFRHNPTKNISTWNFNDWITLSIICSLIWLASNAFFEMILYSPVMLSILFIYLAMLPSKYIRE